MKTKFLIIVLFSMGLAYAANPNQIANDLTVLNKKINKLNQDISQKQKQKEDLEDAINDSNDAIDHSQDLLSKLKEQRDLDVTKLNEISDLLESSSKSIDQIKSNVGTQIATIYQQIKVIQTRNNSILSGNENLNANRKKMYLIQILKQEQDKYTKLQEQLDQLSTLNQRLTGQILALDKKLGDTKSYAKMLKREQAHNLRQKEDLATQINNEKNLLQDIKQKYDNLNNLLAKVYLEQENQTKLASKTPIKTGKIDLSYEDDSPFFKREHVNPVNGKVLLPFGVKTNNVQNNGILYQADNLPVYALSSGRVIYAGTFAGFGGMIVIDHGSKYNSIYSGVKIQVKNGQAVKVGQVIAQSGTIKNQPMGGVYFELRHLGKPVNPSNLLN